MSVVSVTDLDYFVGLGHPEGAVREALLIARGNRNAALYLLAQKGDVSTDKGQLAWRKETSDDWVEAPAKSTPNIAENRALHKSPIYIFVEDYHPGDDPNSEYIFNMQITLKDGRQWKIGHTYTECTSFYNSLPFGTCRGFKNSFPPVSKYQFVFGGDLPKFKLDRRLAGLSEWMRELTLNEACMSSPKILDLLYNFINVDSNGGRPGAKKLASTEEEEPATAPVAPPPALLKTTSPLLLETQDSTEVAAARRKSQYVSQAPLLGPEQLPITMEQSIQLMPFKVSVKKLQCYHDLLAMKLSKETKDVEEAHRREDDAELAAALAASHEEALARERFEAEIAPREEANPFVPADEQLDSADNPLHHVEGGADADADADADAGTSGEGGAVVLDDVKVLADETPVVPPQPTICLPPQPPASISTSVVENAVPVRVLQRLRSASFLNMKIDTTQLQKDCRRDRIVVQGKRLDGAYTQLIQIYTLCQENILLAMGRSGKIYDLGLHAHKPPMRRESSTNPFDFSDDGASSHDSADSTPMPPPSGPQCMLQADEELARALHRAELSGTADSFSPPASPHAASPKSAHGSPSKPSKPSTVPVKPSTPLQADCETLSRVTLSMISRTESGYLSHASLHEIFDIENKLHAPDFIPYFFVPEATLSDPLQLSFNVLERGGAPQATRGKYAQPALAEEWCIECSGETSTVYRLLDASSLVPLLQIRVTYQVTLFGMPQYQPPRGAARLEGQAGQVVTGLHIKEGKCQILIDKVTTTTARDWNSSPQRM